MGHHSASLNVDEVITARKLLVLLLEDTDPESKRKKHIMDREDIFSVLLCETERNSLLELMTVIVQP